MLKAPALAIGLLAVCLPRAAESQSSLVTGAIRDQAGTAIPGAHVTALDGAGRIVGADVAAADGTFAVDVRVAPAAVSISCDYCRSARLAIEPGEPVIAIVERYRILASEGPSSDDIGALPYRSAADVASLLPFRVLDAGRISDRGLDFEGATLIDGLPFYRAADGGDFSALVPAHGAAAVDAISPLAAPLYGGYAGAGVIDVLPSNPDVSTSRFDLGDAGDIIARFDAPAVHGAYSASSDIADDRQAANADATLPFAGGRLSFNASDLTNQTDHASGAGIAYATDSRRFSTAAAVSATQSSGASFVALDAHVRSSGPLGLEFGARATRATSAFGNDDGTQADNAVYVAAGRAAANGNLSAIVAWDRGGNAGIAGAAPSTALVGSFSAERRLGARWTAHAGVVSNLRIPTFAEVVSVAPIGIGGDRSLLFEQSFTYTDLRRLRARGLVYTQRSTGSAVSHVNGVGIDSAWQLAPAFSVRAWVLRANESALAANADTYAYAYAPNVLPPGASASAAPLTRQLVWFTYGNGNGVRFDALVRGGPLEGDVRVPCGGAYAFALGSAVYNGRRVTTFGITRR